ncbi:MAG TPA: competence/damage-inducible protein A [Acidimicrobiia bacterium]|jgi:nicotinamide-nucleotide amidase|nr:competence/damage-inducible protein A [Acidimicrobiia bacterium]
MRCEILAIGTELLLGQIVDTNSAWIGEQLAASGIDSYEHRAVGDNQARIVAALRDQLSRSDAVLICGGLGPTQDDLTRDAIAELMGVPLVRHDELAETIAQMFRARVRDMPQNNLRQADIPEGGEAIPNPIGTAPGLRCELPDAKIVYAVPGVPYEMKQMVTEHVIPDLLRRSGEAAAIVSTSLKTWGTSESALAEMVAHRLDALDAQGGNPTIAFLARGIEGLVVRVTAKAATEAQARALVEQEEKELRLILGDLVFGVDDETMEYAVLERLRGRGWTLGVAESLTGGLIGARIVNVEGASDTFRGSVASYATDVKRSVLGVTAESVVSEQAAKEMAEGAQRVLGADVGIAATGVAGPTEQDGVAVGTVYFGIAIPGLPTEVVSTRLPGDRERLRQFSTISLLNLLRQRLDALSR